MTRRQKQSQFARMVGRLIEFIYGAGYEVTLGDAMAFNLWAFVLPLLKPLLSEKQYKWLRSKAHSKKSFHYDKLAIDLNLFKDGRYLKTTEDHRPIGDFWKSMGGTWGGDFKRKDGNHYSLGEK